MDGGAVVEKADADARRSGFCPVGCAPHDLARHGEVRDIARSWRRYRGHGLCQQQAQHKSLTALVHAQSRLSVEQTEASAGHAQVGRAGLVESDARLDAHRNLHVHPGDQPALR